MKFTITDVNGAELKVGDRVASGDEKGTVLALIEPDGEYDDWGRPVRVGPYVRVEFDNDVALLDCISTHRYTWADYPDGPQHETFACEDVEIVRS